MARTDARTFLRESLLETLGIRALVVGENFRFGFGRDGDAALARETLGPNGVDVAAVGAVLDGGERISSTRVRAAIGSGDTVLADRLLGASYTLRGRIALGAGRGHDLGFPTANVVVPAEKTLPADGVYAAVGRYDGRDHTGLVSIGTNPTFDGVARTVEAWLLDLSRHRLRRRDRAAQFPLHTRATQVRRRRSAAGADERRRIAREIPVLQRIVNVVRPPADEGVLTVTFMHRILAVAAPLRRDVRRRAMAAPHRGRRGAGHFPRIVVRAARRPQTVSR